MIVYVCFYVLNFFFFLNRFRIQERKKRKLDLNIVNIISVPNKWIHLKFKTNAIAHHLSKLSEFNGIVDEGKKIEKYL